MNLIKSLGHGFAIAYHDLITLAKGFATKAPAVAGQVATDLGQIAPIANALFAGIDPALLPLARGAEAILGEAFAAIQQAGADATTQGVIVKIEGDLVAGVQQFVDLLSGHPAVQAAQAATTPKTS
jgi:hypothetical protein